MKKPCKCTLFKDWPWDNKRDLLQGLHALMTSTDNLYLWQTEDKCSWCAGLSMVPTSYCSRNVARYDCTWGRQAVIWNEHTARLYIELEKKSRIEIIGSDQTYIGTTAIFTINNEVKNGNMPYMCLHELFYLNTTDNLKSIVSSYKLDQSIE